MSTNVNNEQLNFEILTKYNKIVVNKTFKFDIDIVYNTFIIPENYEKMHNPLMTNFNQLKGKNKINSINSEFEFNWDEKLNCKFKVKEIIDTPNYKMILLYF